LSFLQSGKANLGEELYKVLTADSNTAEEMLNSLDLKSEHSALEAVNKLEAAIFAWKERVTAQVSGRSPVRTSWSFVKDPVSEFDKMESLLDSAESLLQLLKSRYPNLPQTFLDSTKVQYGKVSSILDLLIGKITFWLEKKCMIVVAISVGRGTCNLGSIFTGSWKRGIQHSV
jgi:hypothetical protein